MIPLKIKLMPGIEAQLGMGNWFTPMGVAAGVAGINKVIELGE
tara:strand:+ start:49 stop:177 length:129 start_codon:yes stop_codon:yes gene_type:complete